MFAWGQGGNGKGVLFNTLAHVLADYAAVAAPDLLLVTNGDRHPTDMAMLCGARLVIASRSPSGRAWTSPSWSLTGGDPITARFMRQDFFTYAPQFTLLVAGNHKPGFKAVDEAVRRRVQLVPLQNIPAAERDPRLGEKLAAEAPAILRWAIDGCLEWQRQGSTAGDRARGERELPRGRGRPGAVARRAVRARRRHARAHPVRRAAPGLEAVVRGQRRAGLGGKTFSKALDERGFHRDKSNGVRGFRGIELRPQPGGEEPARGQEGVL